MGKGKRAAHFLLGRELAGSPPNKALVEALNELGYEVDLYAPGGNDSDSQLSTRIYPVEYGRRWILKHALSPKWRRYALFSGTTEEPMAIVGILSWFHHRPSFTLADEIKSDAYRGGRSAGWKRLCRWAMRRSKFSIVGDSDRVELQRHYAGLEADDPIIVYPSSFRSPPESQDRRRLRREQGVPDHALVLAYAGSFGHLLGADWLLGALEAIPTLHVAAQIVNLDPLTRMLLEHTRARDRLHLDDRTGPGRVSWKEAWSSVTIGDIGMVVYHHAGSQFQRMGTSSNRLCMFLAMGLPVVVSRQPSFAFVEKYDCGVMVESEREFVDAIQFIGRRLAEMKRNALRCAAEYFDTEGRYQKLLGALATIQDKEEA
jgi:glycosyltransferase involved in cell wall biosynthesis